ncbi:hypothetical protein B9Z45_16640, partial [Limnohabitans sp. 2KL-17]|uniref:hypothetical protein n=1 Tax=Limnohabitans sp. 2KL-17 TaxID=1100704 RepID=UPI000DD29041
ALVAAQTALTTANASGTTAEKTAAQAVLDAAKLAAAKATAEADAAELAAAKQMGNLAPLLSAVNHTLIFTEMLGADNGSNAQLVFSGLSASDLDSQLMSATMRITNVQVGDVLLFTDTGKITGSYSNGVLTLATKSGASPSSSEFSAALASVKFNNSSDNPVTTDRQISLVISDGAKNSQTIIQTVQVVSVNDAPTVSAALASNASEGDVSYTVNLLQGATDADAGETATLSTQSLTYQVNGGTASATLPAGVSITGNTLTVDPANAVFNSLAFG